MHHYISRPVYIGRRFGFLPVQQNIAAQFEKKRLQLVTFLSSDSRVQTAVGLTNGVAGEDKKCLHVSKTAERGALPDRSVEHCHLTFVELIINAK